MTANPSYSWNPFSAGAAAPAPARIPSIEERLYQGISRGVDWLLSRQAPQGYWLGELEADTTLESDYILYLHVIGKPDPVRIEKLARYVRKHQLEDGGWNIYANGPSELNATVKAYLGLKLAGDPPEASHMARARARIHELGGLESINSFERFYLALVGVADWGMVPAMPPELLLLPHWFYVNLYEISSWSRGILVPMAILYALRPSWTIPERGRLDELFREPEHRYSAFAWDKRLFTWRNFFLFADRVMKFVERMPWKPLRKHAVRAAERWLMEHLERSEGLGAIYPAMMNAIYALIALGYRPDDPITSREIHELAKFEIEENGIIRLQPCVSPVWDTAIAMVALEEAGLPPSHPALVRAASWMLDNQILGSGDWQVKNPGVEPGGWAFEFRNDHYPDVDDTAFILMALQRVDFPDRARMEAALRRGLNWVVTMQNKDGGWGAFDKDNDCRLLTHVPFADHNAMIDPATADVTARVAECLARMGWPATHPVMKRALHFLQQDQCEDGSWFGRWGVNYVYGTGGVLRALEAMGLARQPYALRGVQWLKSVQQADGGFGESIASYDDLAQKGRGATTASQTSWGLIGLLASTGTEDRAAERALDFLLSTQTREGSWEEAEFTGTGFPKVFYLKYHLYRHYFPLYAVARYRNMVSGAGDYRSMLISPESLEAWRAERRKGRPRARALNPSRRRQDGQGPAHSNGHSTGRKIVGAALDAAGFKHRNGNGSRHAGRIEHTVEQDRQGES
ncbi:MAG TPA: squalene--hopene cyclase [Candidatus Acidoferrales bacterium]|nr:squalene--hopene cyclase [Candidatus Acidoferrales bacterium]